jgi:hypothetical protein
MTNDEKIRRILECNGGWCGNAVEREARYLRRHRGVIDLRLKQAEFKLSLRSQAREGEPEFAALDRRFQSMQHASIHILRVSDRKQRFGVVEIAGRSDASILFNVSYFTRGIDREGWHAAIHVMKAVLDAGHKDLVIRSINQDLIEGLVGETEPIFSESPSLRDQLNELIHVFDYIDFCAAPYISDKDKDIVKDLGLHIPTPAERVAAKLVGIVWKP